MTAVPSTFALTLRWLAPQTPQATTPAAFVQAVCDAHALGNIPHRAVRDLVRYEAALAEVARVSPAAGPLPSDDASLVLSESVRVLVYGAALPEMLVALRAGGRPEPRPARGWILLWRDADGPQELVLRREEGWLLESFREPAKLADAVEDDEDRALVAWMWKNGILVLAQPVSSRPHGTTE